MNTGITRLIRSRLFRIFALVIVTPLTGWAFIERVSGPTIGPIPSSLPNIIRKPAPLRADRCGPAPQTVNPGDEVLRLHARGIKGRNVGIAVIDRFLLTEHREFRDRLQWYDEIDANAGETAQWHGTAVASIAVGETIGVAPEADLYFVGIGGIWAGEPVGNWFVAARRAMHTGQTVALAIERVLEMNRHLEPDRKIRAIAIAVGRVARWLDDREPAIAEARAQGIFVSSIDLNPRPLGPVAVANATAADAYCWIPPAPSWAIAYWAGRYALAYQENPSITPEEFEKTIPH